MLKLYFSPLACSLATRISLYEAGIEAEFVEVDPKTKRLLADGRDYREVYDLGLVPALALEDGTLLTENAAILQYVAERYPEAQLAPRDARGRAALQQWLCFIGTELHKALFVPVLDRKLPEAVHAYALAKAPSRLAWLAKRLEAGEYVLDRFSVADAYLVTILNWSSAAPVDLKPYAAIGAYLKRMYARPAVARAIMDEKKLYARELERHASNA
jgi:glutathione S-transferase